jgi:myo-inositol-1(or 4)-monophosphatase
MKELLQLAKKAAYTSGQYLRGSAPQIDKLTDNDIKLIQDIKSQEIILEILNPSRFPNISEESGANLDFTKSDEYFWIVDPLDGTHNYQKGIHLCCVSIALWKGNRPILGVIYDFFQDKFYVGNCLDAKDNENLLLSTNTNIAQATLFSGFPSNFDRNQKNLSEYLKLLSSYKKIRFIGSAALSLAYVAGGKGEAYFENEIFLWDIAAGFALIEAAGGITQLNPTKKPFQFTAFAGNDKLNSIYESK